MIRIGGTARTLLVRVRLPGEAAVPDRISIAVPATGSTAAIPGNGVSDVITMHAVISITAPVTAMVSRLNRVRRRRNVGGTNATMAPTPSSQARVSVEKYADEGDSSV